MLDASWTFYIRNNKSNIGRASTHNNVVSEFSQSYNFFVFSDLDTKFTASFPSEAFAHLKDNPALGAISAKVVFKSASSHGNLFSRLFSYDVFIRTLSSYSGLCMKASGPGVILRSCVWSNISSFEDVDHCMGFLCISEGYLLCYSDKFEVIDIPNNSIRKDVNARSRMTRKSLLSFRERLSSFLLRGPITTMSVLSVLGYFIHKPLRFIALPIFVFSSVILQIMLLGYISIPLLLLEILISPLNFS